MCIKKLEKKLDPTIILGKKKANEQYILNKPKGTVVITVAFITNNLLWKCCEKCRGCSIFFFTISLFLVVIGYNMIFYFDL